MTHYEKPRLFRKTLRTNDSAVSSAGTAKPSPSRATAVATPSLASFVFSHKVKRKQKKDEDRGTGGVRGISRPQEIAKAPRSIRKLTLLRRASPLREAMNLSATVGPGATISCQPSRSASPRLPTSTLHIEAINLELELTSLLCQAEALPSPQRGVETFQAHMRVLKMMSEKDPVYGTVLREVWEEVSRTLLAIRAKEARELVDQNKSLKKYLTDQKESLRRESQERSTQERMTETLLKEKYLLGKKVEQLQLHCRKAAATRQPAEDSERKIEELQEGLRDARKREERLLRLLEVVKKGAQRDGDCEVVPPLDLLLMKEVAGISRAPSRLPSATSTEALKTSFSLDLL